MVTALQVSDKGTAHCGLVGLLNTCADTALLNMSTSDAGIIFYANRALPDPPNPTPKPPSFSRDSPLGKEGFLDPPACVSAEPADGTRAQLSLSLLIECISGPQLGQSLSKVWYLCPCLWT